MRFLLLSIFLSFFSAEYLQSQASSSQVDSLTSIYNDLKPGDERIDIGQQLTEILLGIDRIKAKELNLEIFPQARISNNPLLKAKGYYLNHRFVKKDLDPTKLNEFYYLDSASAVLDKNFDTIDQREANLLKYLILNSRGINFSNKGNYDKAIGYYQQALSVAKEIDDPYSIAKARLNIGISHYDVYNFEEAVTHFKSLSDYTHEHKVTVMEASSLNYLGSSYQMIDSFDQAKFYVQKAMNLAKEVGNEQQIRLTLLVMGELSQDLEQPDSAMFYLQRCLEETLGQDAPFIEAQVYWNMARVESQRNNRKEARIYFKKADELSKKVNLQMLDAKLLIDIASFEYDGGNHKLAYDLLLKGYQQQDSITAIENRKLIKELELQYGKAEDEKLIANQELSIVNTQKKIAYLTSGLLFSFLGFLTFYAFYQNAKRGKELVKKELALKTAQIADMEKEKSILALSSTLEGQEAERSRIAQDLHDGLGGLLSAVKAHYGKIQKEILQLESLKVFDTAEGMLDNACEEVRRISHNLMPPLLRSQGLVSAFKGLFNRYRSKNLSIIFDERNMDARLEDTQEVFLYRIAQELLANVSKHSKATEVEIGLYGLGNSVQLIIEDNGIGFNEKENLEGMGLMSIRSRVEYLGGDLDIESAPGNGSTISVTFPRNIKHD